MTQSELKKLGWQELDVILVSGDAYIDSPFSGIALIGKSLLNAGFKVGVITQPNLVNENDILRLGTPKLFWGVSSGTTDSMVANYTSSGKKRKSCDFTAGGLNNRRPDRAVIAYTNLIKRYDKSKKPIVLGGIEASLRRLSHYDQHSDKVRRPILLDSKADYLIYGMGEITVIKVAEAIKNGDLKQIEAFPGIVYLSNEIPIDSIILSAFEEVAEDKEKFHDFFDMFYRHTSTFSIYPLAQKCGGRWVIHNPPFIMNSEELDSIHRLHFERSTHPYDRAKGAVKAEDIVKTSIATHRGCFGECSFCAISVHQGRTVISRSEESILSEIKELTKKSFFKGSISDLGGPTANMYGSECAKMKAGKPCTDKRCLFPNPCKTLSKAQSRYVNLLKRSKKVEGVKKVYVSSGIRCDLALFDKENGENFIRELAKYHTSGQIKLAPEHIDNEVLSHMGKGGIASTIDFADKFKFASSENNKKQFITCYFMAAHPASTIESMKRLKSFINENFNFAPEQVQIFTPTPSTWSTCMYYTEMDRKKRKIFVEKRLKEKVAQKEAIINKERKSKKR